MSGHVEEFIILNHVGKKIIKKLNEFFYVCIKICIKKKAVIVYKLIYSLKFLQIRKWPFVVWAACRKRKFFDFYCFWGNVNRIFPKLSNLTSQFQILYEPLVNFCLEIPKNSILFYFCGVLNYGHM
jgi:uncharacterized protein YlbG (UPF0298 family)